MAYATKHAYGLTSANGAEILIHVGLDTVNLKGEHFQSFVEQGQMVHAGDKLGSIDLEAVKQAGYDTTVMLVVTNSDEYQEIKQADSGSIQHGDQLLELKAKR